MRAPAGCAQPPATPISSRSGRVCSNPSNMQKRLDDIERADFLGAPRTREKSQGLSATLRSRPPQPAATEEPRSKASRGERAGRHRVDPASAPAACRLSEWRRRGERDRPAGAGRCLHAPSRRIPRVKARTIRAPGPSRQSGSLLLLPPWAPLAVARGHRIVRSPPPCPSTRRRPLLECRPAA